MSIITSSSMLQPAPLTPHAGVGELRLGQDGRLANGAVLTLSAQKIARIGAGMATVLAKHGSQAMLGALMRVLVTVHDQHADDEILKRVFDSIASSDQIPSSKKLRAVRIEDKGNIIFSGQDRAILLTPDGSVYSMKIPPVRPPDVPDRRDPNFWSPTHNPLLIKCR